MKYDGLYIDIAVRLSQESKCPRTKVGCVILLESGLTAFGFNGHASGGPNEWSWTVNGNPEVVHSELNALGKLLEEGVSAKNATMYLTLSPCLDCSKLIVRSKIKRVVYLRDYRITTGLDYLRKYNVEVQNWDDSENPYSYSGLTCPVEDNSCPSGCKTH